MSGARTDPLRWRTWAIPAFLVLGVGAAVVVSRMEGRRWVAYPPEEVAAVKDVHAYRGAPVCQACHPREDGRLAMDPVPLCTRCHDRLHHPVDVTRAADLPPTGLPLGPDRRVVCHTCHDQHAVHATPRGLRLELPALCTRCHGTR